MGAETSGRQTSHCTVHACWPASLPESRASLDRAGPMASGRVPRYRVIDPVRDPSGHHPESDATAAVARRAPLPDPSPQLTTQQQQQQPFLGAAAPPPQKVNPAPLPPRPKLRRVAPVASATPGATSAAATPAANAAAAAAAAAPRQPGEAATVEGPSSSILTPEQKVLVDELRVRVADALRDDPAAARLGDESALHRFICARQGSVEDAEAMFRGRLEWHREVKTAECRSTPFPLARQANADVVLWRRRSIWTSCGQNIGQATARPWGRRPPLLKIVST